MMRLSRENLNALTKNRDLEIPDEKILELPEKVLQFGTGVLLRALPDYFIDKANKKGTFNGRIVIVKSTDSDSTAFDEQNSLYTICVRGVEQGETVKENIINASVSRVLSARSQWNTILDLARNPEMKIVFSNTTEVGIQLVQDDISGTPPVSFPGKLLAFLHERYKAFKGSSDAGMVIVPTELITDNDSKLESIVLELAHRNNLDFKFIEWLENHNTFCNSLVDRIVPGKPNDADLEKIQSELGYTDDLLTMSEVFRLWAIEGDEQVKDILSFAQVDKQVIITPDITLFKELKLRLLNGTHSFNCGLAFLSGFNITRDAVMDKTFSVFAKNLMHKEIAEAIPYPIDKTVKEEFANSTFERFCNPFIDHQWLSITVQYTSKMKMRNVPLLKRHYDLFDHVPAHMAAGFAGFLQYMKVIKAENGKFYGERNGQLYEIKDDSAALFYETWKNNDPGKVAEEIMGNEKLWDCDLSKLPGLLACVQEYLNEFETNGVVKTLAELETKKITA